MEKNRKRFAKMFYDRLVLDDGSVYPIVLYKKFEILKLKIKFYLLKNLPCLLLVAQKTTCKSGRASTNKRTKNLKITNYNRAKQNKKPKLELKPTQNINQLRRVKKSRRNKSA
jgi:hypothetical protein